MNVFSFCLYGPRCAYYYDGLLENVALVATHFPTWMMYVYYGPDVDEQMLQDLGSCPHVVLRPTGVTGPINMIHRFYAIDEEGVDLMLVRDADSRIHWKDRWAIRQFLSKPEFVAHTIRDNVQHTSFMMGGLWGIRKSAGLNLAAEYATYAEDTSRGTRWGHDQNFLADVIYPKISNRLLVHYSNGRIHPWEHGIEFPFQWSKELFCGLSHGPYFVDTSEPPRIISGIFSILPYVRNRPVR